jgi:biotin transport system substrate-specific component
MLAGSIVIYAFGLAWLSHFVPSGSVLSVGLYPFIPGDLAKVALATAVLPSGWALLNKFRT